MNFMQSVRTWLGSGFSVFVYIAIVLLFLIGVCKCLLPVSRNRRRLDYAVKQIKQGNKARHSWQEEKFLGRGSLLPHWSEYLNNLFFADGEFHNPANVEDYINEETVINGPGSVKLCEALPGVLVSLGFLGTLLGLSQALSEMNSVDAQTITSSMNTLLSSMKYAFLTSIFGVVASILFQLLTKITHGRTENELRTFYNAMARHAGVLSVDPMTQVAIYQQEQTGLLKQLTQALATDNLSNLLKPVVHAADMTAERQKVLMEGVADAYIAKMNAAMNGQLEALSSTIESTCRVQERLAAGMANALGDFTDAAAAIHSIREDVLDAFSRIEKLQVRLSSELDSLNDRLDTSAAVTNRQDEALKNVSALCLQLSGESRKMSESAQAYLDSTEKLSRDTADELSAAAAELAGVMADAREKLSRDTDESIDYFEDCMTRLIKRVEKAAKAVTAVSERLNALEKKAEEDMK